MSFSVTIDNVEVPSRSLVYRDMGFGKPVTLPTSRFLIEVPVGYAVGEIKEDVDDFVEECRVDDEDGEVELPCLRVVGYPSCVIMARKFPDLLCQIIKEYLYFSVLGKLLDKNPRSEWKYAVNSIDVVFIEGESLYIQGEVYELV